MGLFSHRLRLGDDEIVKFMHRVDHLAKTTDIHVRTDEQTIKQLSSQSTHASEQERKQIEEQIDIVMTDSLWKRVLFFEAIMQEAKRDLEFVKQRHAQSKRQAAANKARRR